MADNYCANCIWSVWFDGSDLGYCGKTEKGAVAIYIDEDAEDNDCLFYNEKGNFWSFCNMIEEFKKRHKR